MTPTRIRAIRVSTAAAALLAFGLGTAASAEPVRRLATNSNAVAARDAGQSQLSTGAQDRQICVRTQRVNSRITSNICRTETEWEARGGLLPEEH